MNFHRMIFVNALIAIGSIIFPCMSQAQVDPFWLRSWQQAQETRPAEMSYRGRIAAQDEPGTAFVIHGQVFESDGETPVAGAVVHSYHRDQSGFDFGVDDADYPIWRLQGWVKTDAAGRFEFHTIRPAPDIMGRDGAHIHFTIETPDLGKQWAPTVFLFDDSLVSEAQKSASEALGEFGPVRRVETINQIQTISVKIKLKKTDDFR